MKSVIVGAGAYGEVYLAFLREASVDIIGFLDDNPELEGGEVQGIPVIGRFGDLPMLKERYGIEAVYCPLGDNKRRVQILDFARELGYSTPNFIHSSVRIAPEVQIAPVGVYILQSTQIMPYVIIERDVMISSGSNIVHHSRLSQGTFISNGVNFGANVIAKKFAYVGMGATVMTGVKSIGEDCLIGAGTVVIKDVPDNAVVAGVPARIIRMK